MAWHKTSRHERGYGAEWDRLKKIVKARDFEICQPCKAKGIIHLGREVDHIVSKAKAKLLGWTDAQVNDLSNLQCICHEAHKAKTEEEQGKKLRPRVKIGLDGWPIKIE